MRLTKVTKQDSGWIAKKTGFAILSSLPKVVTGEKVPIPDFRETQEDDLRLLAVASQKMNGSGKTDKNANPGLLRDAGRQFESFGSHAGLPRIDQIETLHCGRFLALEKVHFTDETGKERDWERTTRVNSCGAVMIVPHIVPQDEYVLVRQFRAPAQKYTIEFPAGLIDPGENAAQTAVRELLEETGFEGKITEILPAAFSSPGLSPETITPVLMEIDGSRYTSGLPQAHPEENEHIQVLRIPVRELKDFLLKRISAGDGTDAKLFAYCR